MNRQLELLLLGSGIALLGMYPAPAYASSISMDFTTDESITLNPSQSVFGDVVVGAFRDSSLTMPDPGLLVKSSSGLGVLSGISGDTESVQRLSLPGGVTAGLESLILSFGHPVVLGSLVFDDAVGSIDLLSVTIEMGQVSSAVRVLDDQSIEGLTDGILDLSGFNAVGDAFGIFPDNPDSSFKLKALDAHKVPEPGILLGLLGGATLTAGNLKNKRS